MEDKIPWQEIENLIQQTEAEGLIRAPSAMKGEILEKAEQWERRRQEKRSGRAAYRLRVLGSMAAALCMLFSMDSSMLLRTSQSMAENFYETTESWNDRLDIFSGRIFQNMMEVVHYDK